jgi:hypothetical protein
MTPLPQKKATAIIAWQELNDRVRNFKEGEYGKFTNADWQNISVIYSELATLRADLQAANERVKELEEKLEAASGIALAGAESERRLADATTQFAALEADRRRMDVIVRCLTGSKWADVGAGLQWIRPEGSKYIGDDLSLRQTIDAALASTPAKEGK